MGAFYKNVGGTAVKFGDADAGGISYDNSESGMRSAEVKSALDELVRKLSDGSVKRVGTADVGSTVRPMYLDGGTPKALTGNVGASNKPVYMSSGQVTAASSTIGSANQPVYMDNGVIKPMSFTVAKSVPADAKFTDTVYSHPTTAGNKHVPSGGAEGQFLGYAGSSGLASWQAIPKYINATQSADGLMSAADKKKLDGMSSSQVRVSMFSDSRSVKPTTSLEKKCEFYIPPCVCAVVLFRAFWNYAIPTEMHVGPKSTTWAHVSSNSSSVAATAYFYGGNFNVSVYVKYNANYPNGNKNGNIQMFGVKFDAM